MNFFKAMVQNMAQDFLVGESMTAFELLTAYAGLEFSETHLSRLVQKGGKEHCDALKQTNNAKKAIAVALIAYTESTCADVDELIMKTKK